MYFDTFIRNNPSLTNNFNNLPYSHFNQQPLQNLQQTPSNFNTFLNKKLAENTQNSNTHYNRNLQQQHYYTRPNTSSQTAPVNNHSARPLQFQSVNNNIFFHNQSVNPQQNRENIQSLKKKDSLTESNYFKQTRDHSPFNHQGYFYQKSPQNLIKPTSYNQPQHIIHQQARNATSNINLTSFSPNGLSEHNHSPMLQSNIRQRDFNQQILNEKSGIYKQMYYSNLKLDQGKFPAKPYGFGFKSSNQNSQLQQKRKSQIPLKFQNKQKNTENAKDLMYNFQLKNVSSDWKMPFNGNEKTDDLKFSTPSIIKKHSMKQSSINQSKNDLNKTENLKTNSIILQKQNHQVDLKLNKSSSSDILLSNTYYKQNNRETNEQYQAQNVNDFANNDNNQIVEKVQKSYSHVNFNNDNRKQRPNKSYQALIQNLQKKFCDQKRSSDSFQMKERTYQTEINKKQDQIKTLQTTLENNRETIQDMEETIKLLRKNNHLQQNPKSELNSTIQVKSILEEGLRRENAQLKEELSKEMSKSANSMNLNIQTQEYELKNKLLQRSLQDATENLYNKTSKIQQLSKQLFHNQAKYQGSLEKLLAQEQVFEKQKLSFQQTVQQLIIEKRVLSSEQKRLESQVQKLQSQLKFKQMEIRSFEEKSTENEKWNVNPKEQQFLPYDYEIVTQELQSINEKLIHKEKINEQLSQQLKEKYRIIEKIMFQKAQLQCEIDQLQLKIKTQSNVEKNSLLTTNQQNPKKTSDSAQASNSRNSNNEVIDYKKTLSLIDFYHQKYAEIVNLFNLLENSHEKIQNSPSFISMSYQAIHPIDTISPSKDYLNRYHSLITDQVKKIFSDLKKLLITLNQSQIQSQQKSQRLYELDKTLKKQANKINALIAEIHNKNIAITEINKMQIEKEVIRLNEKYQILLQINY